MTTGEQGGSAPQPIAPAKFWLTCALVIVAVGILLAWAWMPPRHEEPVYQGKTLSKWLAACAAGDRDRGPETQSEAAIRKIGTNGIPTLLRLIQTPDSYFRSKLKALMEKQTFIEAYFEAAEDSRYMAWHGFEVLGEAGKGAVPDLLTLAKKPSGTVGRGEVILALGCIDPSAQATIPALVSIASDPKDQERGYAIYSLFLMRSTAESVMPLFESCLRDTNASIRRIAAIGLSRFGETGKSSIPALILLLSDPDWAVRYQATNAVKLIDREAATKAGIP